MKKGLVFMVLFNAAAITFALLIIGTFVGTYGVELGILTGIPMMLAVSISEFELYKKAEYSEERDAVMFGLQQIYSSARYAGKSFIAGMNDALEVMDVSTCTMAHRLLSGIRKRLLLGAQLDDAIKTTCAGSYAACAPLRDVGREYANGRDPVLAVKNAYDRLTGIIKMEDARNAGRLQRYLTISMAVGTVLPSFAVFTFTGYSMICYSHMLLSIFCVVMLIIIPNIFALVRAHTAGLYEI